MESVAVTEVRYEDSTVFWPRKGNPHNVNSYIFKDLVEDEVKSPGNYISQ